MIVLTQLIYVHAGREAAFHEFEDRVLPLLGRHGGELLLRLRPERAIGGSCEVPYEVHVVRFADEAALDAYASDPERLAVVHLRDASVREVITFTSPTA